MNLEHVARRAKVSTATVSRVLNNASVVKASTRARVERAIEELKFFFDIYKTIESDAHARGYEVVVANTDYKSEQLVSSIRLMIGRRVAGLAAIVSEMEPALIKELTESRIPVVFYDGGQPRQNITNIRVNYRRGIDKVIDYLHSVGHRRLGFVGHHAMLGPINDRMKAVLDAVARNSSLQVEVAADADILEGGRRRERCCRPDISRQRSYA
jgi:LacI family transcriptional regulator